MNRRDKLFQTLLNSQKNWTFKNVSFPYLYFAYGSKKTSSNQICIFVFCNVLQDRTLANDYQQTITSKTKQFFYGSWSRVLILSGYNRVVWRERKVFLEIRFLKKGECLFICSLFLCFFYCKVENALEIGYVKVTWMISIWS